MKLVLLLMLCLAGTSVAESGKWSYTQFLEQVREGKVAGVVISSGGSAPAQATCRLKDGTTAETVLPAVYRDALAAMEEKRVDVEIRDSSSVLAKAAPFLMLLAIWVFLFFFGIPRKLRSA